MHSCFVLLGLINKLQQESMLMTSVGPRPNLIYFFSPLIQLCYVQLKNLKHMKPLLINTELLKVKDLQNKCEDNLSYVE